MRTACTFAAVVTVFLGNTTLAQLVPPPPPATPATQPYEPPPPPPPAPPPPPRPAPEPEAPLPSLVERDERGGIKPPGMPLEEAAVRALMPEFNEETRAKVDEVLAQRRAEVDRKVAANIPLALDLRKKLAGIDEVEDFGKLLTLTQSTKPLEVKPGILDRLQRDRAITPQQKRRADAVIKEYHAAVDKELEERLGNENVMAIASVKGRDAFKRLTLEPLASLERMFEASAGEFERLAAEGRGAAARYARAPEAERKALRYEIFEALTPEQQAAVLRAGNPAAFEEPADTATGGAGEPK